MHRLIWERLEELLGDAPVSRLSGEIKAHLETCQDCRGQLEAFRRQVHLLRTLRGDESLSPAPGFYFRVLDRIQARRNASVWNALLDPGLSWRLAFGSLAALLILGALLVVRESRPPMAHGAPPEAVIVLNDHPPELGVDLQRDRETVLVTLATYRE